MQLLILALILHMKCSKEPDRFKIHIAHTGKYRPCSGFYPCTLHFVVDGVLFPQLFPFPLISFSFFKIQLCFENAHKAPEQPCSFLHIEGDALALVAKLSSRDADSPLRLDLAWVSGEHFTPSVPQHSERWPSSRHDGDKYRERISKPFKSSQ